MHTSDQIDQIAAALSAAQAEMTGAKKSSKNPFFKSTYADLSAVMAAISEPFAAHGLAFVQSAGLSEGGVSVTTRLMHSSGQWIESDPMTVPPVKNDPQAFGSAVTYAKRYSLQALVGVPSVDDDGNAATQAVRPAAAVQVDVEAISEALRKGAAEGGMDGLVAAWGQLSQVQRKHVAKLKDALKAELEGAA